MPGQNKARRLHLHSRRRRLGFPSLRGDIAPLEEWRRWCGSTGSSTEHFKAGAAQLVFQTGKPIAQVARELGINEGTLGNWCAVERRRRENGNAALSEDERAELVRLYRGDR